MSERNRGVRHHRTNRGITSRNKDILIAGGVFSTALVLTGCDSSGRPPIQASIEQKTITGDTTLAIGGVTQEDLQMLDPGCTKISYSEGSERIQDVSVQFQPLAQVRVSPEGGVEGGVSGVATVGYKDGSGQCIDAGQAPFHIQVDTKPTYCSQQGVQGNTAIIGCDGSGQALDATNGGVISGINSNAVIPIDPNVRVRDLTIVDTVGNTSGTTVSLQTDCAGANPPGARYNAETGMAELHIQCNGDGYIVTAQGTDAYVSGREAWVPVPPGTAHIDGSVDNNYGLTTSFGADLPAISPPSGQVGNIRIEAGKLVAEGLCDSALDNPCQVILGDQSIQVPGDASFVGRIELPVVANAEPQPLQAKACDSLGGCTDLGTVVPPIYSPFAGDTVNARVGDAPNSLIVEVEHPDQQHNLIASAPPIKVTQETPMKSVPWARDVLEWIAGTNEATCAPTIHERDLTIYSCDLPFSHGEVAVLTGLQELNGAVMPLTTSVGVADYPPEFQKAVEVMPFAFGLFVIGILALETWLLAKGYKEKRQEENIREAQKIINAHGFNQPEEVKARVEKTIGRMHDDRGREMALFWKQRMILSDIDQLYEGRIRRKYKSTHEMDTAFSTEPLQRFIKEFNNQNTEQAVKKGYQGFFAERNRIGERLLVELDDIIRRNFTEGPEGRYHIRKDILVRDEIFELLTMLYASENSGWFWQKVAASERAYRQTQRKDNTEIRISMLTRKNMEKTLMAIASAQGLLQRKWGSKLFRMFKAKRVKGESTPTYEQADRIMQKLQVY